MHHTKIYHHQFQSHLSFHLYQSGFSQCVKLSSTTLVACKVARKRVEHQKSSRFSMFLLGQFSLPIFAKRQFRDLRKVFEVFWFDVLKEQKCVLWVCCVKVHLMFFLDLLPLVERWIHFRLLRKVWKKQKGKVSFRLMKNNDNEYKKRKMMYREKYNQVLLHNWNLTN